MARKIPQTITEEDFMKIYNSTKNNRYRLSFALGFYQCMRISEVVKLTPEFIDRQRNLIMIKEAKGKKDRNIPINPKITNLLKHLPIQRTARAIQIAFRKRAIKLLGKDISFHSLRHSGATYYLKKGKEIRYIQNFLGHSRLDTTQIYTHVEEKDLFRLMEGE